MGQQNRVRPVAAAVLEDCFSTDVAEQVEGILERINGVGRRGEVAGYVSRTGERVRAVDLSRVVSASCFLGALPSIECGVRLAEEIEDSPRTAPKLKVLVVW